MEVRKFAIALLAAVMLATTAHAEIMERVRADVRAPSSIDPLVGVWTRTEEDCQAFNEHEAGRGPEIGIKGLGVIGICRGGGFNEVSRPFGCKVRSISAKADTAELRTTCDLKGGILRNASSARVRVLDRDRIEFSVNNYADYGTLIRCALDYQCYSNGPTKIDGGR
jgi:hypothetical protein